MLGALGLLVEVFTDVRHDVGDALRVEQHTLFVDRRDFGVVRVSDFDGVDVVDAEGEHVLVGDGIDDRVGVQLVTEGLLSGPQLWVSATTGVDSEDGCAGEAEEVVVLEGLGDRGVHVAELRAVALIEDDHDMPVVDRVALVRADERRQLLDRGDDDPGTGVLELLFQHRGRGVRVRGTLFEPVVLTHRLVVEVLAVYDEQHLVDTGQFGCQLRGLKRGQGLTGAGGVPHVPAGGDTAEGLIVRGDVDALQDPLGRDDLIRAHDQQHPVGGEDAVLRQDAQQ